eukprot:GHVS01004667.1.p2 GENE.GHVS01004667.1~~GHVS01004667.1.p2  ORF type:complete len:328 (-),score=23.01 GHVS01004667.1:310-1293(-)
MRLLFSGTDFYKNYLRPLLIPLYDACLETKLSMASEGCACFVRRDRFHLVEKKVVEFKTALTTIPEYKHILDHAKARWPGFMDLTLPSLSTIYQFVVLQVVAPTASALSGYPPYVVFANTHLYYHHNAGHIRAIQLYMMLNEIHKMLTQMKETTGEAVGVILCGDLNCVPGSGGVRLLSTGMLDERDETWMSGPTFAKNRCLDQPIADIEASAAGDGAVGGSLSCSATGDGNGGVGTEGEHDCLGLRLSLPINLRDAYAGKELKFTNYVTGFNSTLDYIYISDHFEVMKTLGGVDESDVLARGGLPSVEYPSDHIAIAVDLAPTQRR